MTGGPVIVDETKRGPDRDRVVRLVVLGLVLVLLALVVPRALGAGAGDDVDLSELSAAPVATSAPSTTTTEAPTVAPVAGADRNPFAPLNGAAAPPPPPPVTTTTTAPPAPKRFELVDVYTDAAGVPSAKVRLDGTQMTVKSGEDFASSFRTMSLDLQAKCGAFLYQDRRFSLCSGEGYGL